MVEFTTEQKAERRKSIGASEAFRAIHLDFSLWAEKTGRAEPPSLDEIERVKWGNRNEAAIVYGFGEDTGRYVERNNEVAHHPVYDFMSATLDASQTDLVGHPSGRRGALEVKNVDAYLFGDWKESPPLKCQVQLQHQLEVRGMSWGSVAALVGGNRLCWFDQDRNPTFIDAMIEKEAEFWKLVTSDTPPPPDGSAATTAVLKRLYPKDDGVIIALPIDANNWDRAIVTLKQRLKVDKEVLDKYENKMKAALGTATTGVLPNGERYTFKRQAVNHEAREAFSSSHRVLRRVQR